MWFLRSFYLLNDLWWFMSTLLLLDLRFCQQNMAQFSQRVVFLLFVESWRVKTLGAKNVWAVGYHRISQGNLPFGFLFCDLRSNESRPRSLNQDLSQAQISPWLVVWKINFIFPYIGNNLPSWRSYFSEGWPNHQPAPISEAKSGGASRVSYVWQVWQVPIICRET